MDFKQRFAGRTNTMPKNGFALLLSSPGSPIEKQSWKESHLADIGLMKKHEKDMAKLLGELHGLDHQQRRLLPKLSTPQLTRVIERTSPV